MSGEAEAWRPEDPDGLGISVMARQWLNFVLAGNFENTTKLIAAVMTVRHGRGQVGGGATPRMIAAYLRLDETKVYAKLQDLKDRSLAFECDCCTEAGEAQRPWHPHPIYDC